MSALLISIDGKVFEASRIADISLKDLLLFNTQAEMLGTHYRWVDVERVFTECEHLTSAELSVHPDKFLIPAVLVWMARRTAGDDVTFEEALEVPFAKIERLPDPADRKKKPSGKAKGAKKKPPSRTRKVSAADVADPAELEAALTSKTSAAK